MTAATSVLRKLHYDGPLILTLPGDIPDLIRRGSPATVYSDKPMVVNYVSPSGLASVGPHSAVGLVAIRLDLTDATGRAHTQWWCNAQPGLMSIDSGWVAEVVHHRPDDEDWWTPERIAGLRYVAMLLAGRTP